MITLYELIIKLVAYLFPISTGWWAYEYSNEKLEFAIFGFIVGAIISALVCGFFLTILEINNTLKKILDLLDSKIGNEKNQEIKKDIIKRDTKLEEKIAKDYFGD